MQDDRAKMDNLGQNLATSTRIYRFYVKYDSKAIIFHVKPVNLASCPDCTMDSQLKLKDIILYWHRK